MRAAVGIGILDELRAAKVRRAMLAGRLDEAADHLPESLLDL